MFVKVSVLMTVLGSLGVISIVTFSIASVTSVSMVSYLHHVMFGMGTPSASHVNTAVSGDVTAPSTGGVVILGATERERSIQFDEVTTNHKILHFSHTLNKKFKGDLNTGYGHLCDITNSRASEVARVSILQVEDGE